MKALVSILTLIFTCAVYAIDKDAPGNVEPEPRAVNGSKPLALPDTTLVDRIEDSKTSKFTQICTTAEGRNYKKNEKGFDDCLGRVQGAATQTNPKDPNAARQNSAQKKDSAGVSFQLGK